MGGRSMVCPASGRMVAIAFAIVSGTSAMLSANAGWAQSPTDIIAAGAKWEEVSRAGKVFGEGVVAAKDGKDLFERYYVDAQAGG
jgi:hypothetical protein